MKTAKKEVKKSESESDDQDTSEEEDKDTGTDEEESEESEESDKSKDAAEESDEESEDDDAEESDDEEEGDDSSSKKEDELDLDAELDKERKNSGKPDKRIADEAYKDRKNKRADSDEDDDKPVTRAELAAVEARIRKEADTERALELAKEMAGSDKEAALIVAKWANRTFPKNLTLREQMQEAYAITHSKKIIGERNEAMRALKGKRSIRNDAAGAHRDGNRNPNEPKLPPADTAAIIASGFTFNNVSRQYEKKLPNGRVLIRDNKTKQVRLLPKR